MRSIGALGARFNGLFRKQFWQHEHIYESPLRSHSFMSALRLAVFVLSGSPLLCMCLSTGIRRLLLCSVSACDVEILDFVSCFLSKL